jgi:hypothetical protein
VLIIVIVVCLAALAGGCGGKSEPERSALAENLARLCEKARADTEALGLPGDKGFVVMMPTAKIGLRLAAEIKKLEGRTPAEQRQVSALAESYRFYYNEMRAAVKLYNVAGSEVYAITLDRAKPSLASGDALAVSIGAPECAVRPFPDE